jgi:hypothetical protein
MTKCGQAKQNPTTSTRRVKNIRTETCSSIFPLLAHTRVDLTIHPLAPTQNTTTHGQSSFFRNGGEEGDRLHHGFILAGTHLRMATSLTA